MLKVSSRLFPIGYIISVDAPNFNPNDFYIDGVWEQIKGRVIVGVDEGQTEFNVTGKIGGSKFMQRHRHALETGGKTQPWEAPNFVLSYQYQDSAPVEGTGAMGYAGTGESGNLQPYYTAYIWKLISYSN